VQKGRELSWPFLRAWVVTNAVLDQMESPEALSPPFMLLEHLFFGPPPPPPPPLPESPSPPAPYSPPNPPPFPPPNPLAPGVPIPPFPPPTFAMSPDLGMLVLWHKEYVIPIDSIRCAPPLCRTVISLLPRDTVSTPTAPHPDPSSGCPRRRTPTPPRRDSGQRHGE